MAAVESLPIIFQEAERRGLTRMSDFELVGAAVAALAQERPPLDFPEPNVKGGSLTRIDSSVGLSSGDNIADNFLLVTDDGLLRHRRPSAAYIATARYVGMWPGKEVAALYDVEASFNSSPFDATTKFKPLAAKLIEGDPDPFVKVADRDEATVYMRQPSYHPSLYTFGALIDTDDRTSITIGRTDQVPTPQPDWEAEVWEIKLNGGVGINVPSGQFIRLDQKSVQLSSKSDAKSLAVDLPINQLTIKHTLPVGARLMINGAGHVIAEGVSGVQDELMLKLPFSDLYKYIGEYITWQDITEDFLAFHSEALKRATPISSSAERDVLETRAAAEIQRVLTQTAVHPNIVGCLAVLSELRRSQQHA